MSDQPVVLCDVDARGIANVTLNRPDVNNAYNAQIVQALLDTFASLAGNDQVRLVVIRGNGRHFQAGADLAWLREVSEQDEAQNLETSKSTAQLVRGLNEFPKPTMALIHGACIGGGTGVAAACDVVIAADDAIFAISEARWGVMASVIFPQLNAAIGIRNVRRYAITCERFSATRAREMGLVHETCAPDALEETAQRIIESVLMAAPGAVQQTKLIAMQVADDIMSDEQFDYLSGLHSAKRQTPEAAEGLASFREKRDPAWYVKP